MNKISTIIIILFLISCGNRKSKYSCDFEFFEKTSEIKFPIELKIIDCYDSTDGIIWVHLKFEQKNIKEFIRNAEMHQFSKKEKDKIEELIGSEDVQAINNLNDLIENKVESITMNENTYLKTIEKKNQHVTYILNKQSGLFWGKIDYPDWAGH